MAAPVTITENWIRQKLDIKCDSLEDVRSLTLPGSYQDKIGSLGTALRGFKRLKLLDISRNSLDSLEGLEHQKILENLNLYYNNISSLDELYRLRHNQQLTELDLRLNPVCRTEPDYRLFLIHMLPNLRKLDDRSVRDQERKAALLHFDPDQASEFQDKVPELISDQRQPNPRVEYVNDFGSIPAIKADDCHLLDTVANHDYGLIQPRKITGSTAAQPAVENYATNQLLDVVRRELPSLQEQNEATRDRGDYYHERSPPVVDQTGPGYTTDLQSKYPNIPHIPSDLHRPTDDYQNTNINNNSNTQSKYEEWESVNKGQAHFTPHPDGYREPETYSTQVLPSKTGTHSLPYQPEPNTRKPSQVQQKSTVDESVEASRRYRPDHVAFLTEVCSTVDKYWNGSGSLNKNAKFLALAHSLVQAFVERQMNQEKFVRENRRLEEENHRLRQSLNPDTTVDIRETLNDARKDVQLLRDKLKKTYDENQILQDKLDAMNKSSQTNINLSIATADLEKQKQELEREVNSLKRRVNEMEKVQQLTSMVQEAHKSLLSSNDHLRKELDQTRQRHNSDVKQLHWSYKQLKKTTSGLGSTTSGLSGSTTSGLGGMGNLLEMCHGSGSNSNRSVQTGQII